MRESFYELRVVFPHGVFDELENVIELFEELKECHCAPLLKEKLNVGDAVFLDAGQQNYARYSLLKILAYKKSKGRIESRKQLKQQFDENEYWKALAHVNDQSEEWIESIQLLKNRWDSLGEYAHLSTVHLIMMDDLLDSLLSYLESAENIFSVQRKVMDDASNDRCQSSLARARDKIRDEREKVYAQFISRIAYWFQSGDMVQDDFVGLFLEEYRRIFLNGREFNSISLNSFLLVSDVYEVLSRVIQSGHFKQVSIVDAFSHHDGIIVDDSIMLVPKVLVKFVNPLIRTPHFLRNIFKGSYLREHFFQNKNAQELFLIENTLMKALSRDVTIDRDLGSQLESSLLMQCGVHLQQEFFRLAAFSETHTWSQWWHGTTLSFITTYQDRLNDFRLNYLERMASLLNSVAQQIKENKNTILVANYDYLQSLMFDVENCVAKMDSDLPSVKGCRQALDYLRVVLVMPVDATLRLAMSEVVSDEPVLPEVMCEALSAANAYQSSGGSVSYEQCVVGLQVDQYHQNIESRAKKLFAESPSAGTLKEWNHHKCKIEKLLTFAFQYHSADEERNREVVSAVRCHLIRYYCEWIHDLVQQNDIQKIVQYKSRLLDLIEIVKKYGPDYYQSNATNLEKALRGEMKQQSVCLVAKLAYQSMNNYTLFQSRRKYEHSFSVGEGYIGRAAFTQ